MKGSFIVVFAVAAMLSACGTLGGAISGAGQDLSKAGDWIKSK
jgi:predicted small secreted protein